MTGKSVHVTSNMSHITDIPGFASSFVKRSDGPQRSLYAALRVPVRLNFSLDHDIWVSVPASQDSAYRNRQTVQSLKDHLSPDPQPTWDVETFCAKCDAADHFLTNCRNPVHCDICELDPPSSILSHSALDVN